MKRLLAPLLVLFGMALLGFAFHVWHLAGYVKVDQTAAWWGQVGGLAAVGLVVVGFGFARSWFVTIKPSTTISDSLASLAQLRVALGDLEEAPQLIKPIVDAVIQVDMGLVRK